MIEYNKYLNLMRHENSNAVNALEALVSREESVILFYIMKFLAADKINEK